MSAEISETPDLVWTERGEPRSSRFGDVYFSADDGLAESRAVFLQGCDLPGAWSERQSFTVAELGFGTGLNIAALLDLWHGEGPANGWLNVFSIEAFPLTAREAARALANWPELAAVTEALVARWPAGTPGIHRIDLPEWRATLDLAVGDVEWALSQWQGVADAWFLDGFSPALNPQMWAEPVIDLIVARSAPDARIATFTVAGAVRRGLSERGFQVDKRPGHGRKRERLEARRTEAVTPAAPRPTVAVIGAGIAGAALVRALSVSGIAVTVIEADRPGSGGSGFPAALVTPRLDAGDAVIAGLHAQALERARDLYRVTPGAVISEGVTQLATMPRDAGRFAKIAAQTIWPEQHMTLTHADSGRTGKPSLLMAGALCVHPGTLLEAWFADATWITRQADALKAVDGRWQVLGAEGGVMVEVDRVVIAGGWGTAALLPELGLAPVRGQADWVEVADAEVSATAWGGYLAPTADGFLYGSTHRRGDEGIDVRAGDSSANLETLRSRRSDLAEDAERLVPTARAAVRATTSDRLPICGPVPGRPGLFVLGGLGSRGFCVAPLLAEHLAAVIAGTPSPLPADYAARLDPGRFVPVGSGVA